MKKERVKLTAAEKSELLAEAVITIVLLLLLNLSVIILINLTILQNKNLINGIYFLKKTITFGGHHLWSWQNISIVVMGIGDFIVLYWRLIRRYHQMQLRHVISELHYIAKGHFDHYISFKVKTDLQKVIDSINSLVKSTVNAINEEKAIEKSKDELISNVSHDLRTPLTSIIGYLGLLKNGVADPADQQKYLNIAYMKAEQMKSLAHDLLEYTTLKSDNIKLNLSSLHIFSMLEQVEAGFELEAQEKGIKFNIEARPLDLTIKADPEKLVRIYNNLITNALKYGTGATQINLIANLVNSDEVELRVENNGAQIPKDSLKKIFERFYRVESSRNMATGGTGLGLSITKSVVDLHGGTIRCESDKQWTRFIIRLPLDPKKARIAD
ncbi:HAMP domain-containing sensor histidine kinase [Lactobacillus sp. ESL0681]|uniref:sensor histidine kinase n=1 Tax=Lactobacillus sp. ESL0681 TaxID=2983211 RepID=UPI0023F749AC|nr:HAMP domain-containing sensor histidine kinase [Lactobacillus sp. ESL0681]WEV40032.1 HAMP domain-containing sensor histidine kinase [Lactobacillus sp. ESL0681]